MYCRVSCLLKFYSCFALLVYHVSEIYSMENSIESATTNNTRQYYNHNVRVIEDLLKLALKKNLKKDEGDLLPTDTLDGIYTECILGLSFSCVQKKLIVFLYRLDKMKNINLLGKSVLLVRKETPADTTTLAKVADHVDQAHLKDIIDNLIDRFFDNHSLRLRVPQYFEDSGERDGDGAYVDVDFDAKPLFRESRKKKGGKIKGLKKIMMVIGMMTCMKLAMMAPLMIGMLGLKVMKALLLAVISLIISKTMMLGKVNFHSLLGSHHDWSALSSHGGGWDRNIQEIPSTSTLPYDVEPAASYNNAYTAYRIRPL